MLYIYVRRHASIGCTQSVYPINILMSLNIAIGMRDMPHVDSPIEATRCLAQRREAQTSGRRSRKHFPGNAFDEKMFVNSFPNDYPGFYRARSVVRSRVGTMRLASRWLVVKHRTMGKSAVIEAAPCAVAGSTGNPARATSIAMRYGAAASVRWPRIARHAVMFVGGETIHAPGYAKGGSRSPPATNTPPL